MRSAAPIAVGSGAERTFDVIDATLKARLHPIWVPKVGYRYSVVFDGKLLVDFDWFSEEDRGEN